VIGHGRIFKKSVAWRRAGEDRNLPAGVKLVFQNISPTGTKSVFSDGCGGLVLPFGLDGSANDKDIGTGADSVKKVCDITAAHADAAVGCW
jgi:hypothetical protein